MTDLSPEEVTKVYHGCSGAALAFIFMAAFSLLRPQLDLYGGLLALLLAILSVGFQTVATWAARWLNIPCPKDSH